MKKTTEKMKVGNEYAGKPKVMAEARVFAFSGGKFNAPGGFPAKNHHTSLEIAKSAGLPTRAVAGTQHEGYVTELMIDLFGEIWFEKGKMAVKFIALVDVGDTVTSKATVVSIEEENGGSRVHFNIWCENQHSNKVLVGTASCLAG
ncbi:MAG: MaoC family dehydratase [Dehalococcoidia bacterium]